MKELFVSYLYRVRHDIAFRITLFVGVGLSLLMALLYWGLGKALEYNLISGQMMIYASLSPTQNFGLAIPINLITFTVLEFNQGSIRNKIIAGHSKAQVYTSLVINGLVFTFILVGVYVSLCFGLGTLFGIHKEVIDGVEKWVPGFEPNGMIMNTSGLYAGYTKDFFLGKIITIAIFSYASIVSFTIFFAALFRNIGPCIPVIIVGIMIAYFAGLLVPMFDDEKVLWAARIVDPLYGLSATEIETIGDQTYQVVTNETFISGICSNIAYFAIFYVGGLFIFKNRDVK